VGAFRNPLWLIVAAWAASLGDGKAAAPVPVHGCQNSCRLDQGQDGRWGAFCKCAKQNFAQLASPAKLLDSPRKLTQRLWGQPREHLALASRDACRPGQGELPALGSGNLHYEATSGEVPLCRCVRARTHFPVSLRCEKRGITGETTCAFTMAGSSEVSPRPLRRPTLEDYQACMAGIANQGLFEGHAATCELVTACEPPPACGMGEELFNVAENNECCPRYECQKRHSRPATKGGKNAGSAL